MTLKEILERGPQPPRNLPTDPARRDYVMSSTLDRYNMLMWFAEARKIELRTAYRRWRRRNGLPLSPR